MGWSELRGYKLCFIKDFHSLDTVCCYDSGHLYFDVLYRVVLLSWVGLYWVDTAGCGNIYVGCGPPVPERKASEAEGGGHDGCQMMVN